MAGARPRDLHDGNMSQGGHKRLAVEGRAQLVERDVNSAERVEPLPSPAPTR
jgi:hypothetical protein